MWTVRLSDDAVSVAPAGDVVTVDADVAVVDERNGGDTAARVTLQMTWQGGGRRRRRAATAPAFAGEFFRRAHARGIFAASEDGFAFASDPQKRLRSTFAELGTERNGVHLPLPTECSNCPAR